jgi:hypothetical protein
LLLLCSHRHEYEEDFAVLPNASPGLFTVTITVAHAGCAVCRHSAYPNAAQYKAPFTSYSTHIAVTVTTEASRLKLVDSHHTRTKDLRNMPAAGVW